eukprot:6202092-Pleurochrysis_carterae.AAC.1
MYAHSRARTENYTQAPAVHTHSTFVQLESHLYTSSARAFAEIQLPYHCMLAGGRDGEAAEAALRDSFERGMLAPLVQSVQHVQARARRLHICIPAYLLTYPLNVTYVDRPPPASCKTSDT